MLNPLFSLPYHPIASSQYLMHSLSTSSADSRPPAVGLPLVLGSLSGFQTKDVVRSPWYTDLNPPAFRPPRQAFGIVWPLLYASVRFRLSAGRWGGSTW